MGEAGGAHVAALSAVLRAMAEDEAVVDDVVSTAREHSPAVARLPADETRRHVLILLAAALHVVEGSGADGQDFASAEALGADRAAQGIPIAGLLRGVQAGRSRAMRIAIERGRGAGIPDAVILEAVIDVDRYTGALERHIITGYHDAELELSRTTSDARAQLLRRLLLRTDAGTPTAAELTQAGLPPRARFHCVVSDIADPVRARRVERGLTGPTSWYGLVEGRLAGLTTQPPDTTELDPTTVLVVSPAVPRDALADVYPLCVAAVPLAKHPGAQGFCHLTDLAAETALTAQPVLATLLTTTLLAPLHRTDDFHRDLVTTALAYLDHGQRLGQTAAALHLHANTVRYRLDRLQELIDHPLGDPGPGHPSTVLHTLNLWWALTTWLTGPAD